MYIYCLVFILLTLIVSLVFFTDLVYPVNQGMRDIVNYSLGDVIEKNSFNTIFNRLWYRCYFNNTLADKYYRKTKKINDYETLYKIIEKTGDKNNTPNQDTLIIHLRIDDVVDIMCKLEIDVLLNMDYYETSNGEHFGYLRSYNYFEQKIEEYEKLNDSKKIIIVGGYRHNIDHTKSEEYVDKIKEYFEKRGYGVSLKIGKSKADEDFIYMSRSKYFIPSGGGFSTAISKVVEMGGGFVL